MPAWKVQSCEYWKLRLRQAGFNDPYFVLELVHKLPVISLHGAHLYSSWSVNFIRLFSFYKNQGNFTRQQGSVPIRHGIWAVISSAVCQGSSSTHLWGAVHLNMYLGSRRFRLWLTGSSHALCYKVHRAAIAIRWRDESQANILAEVPAEATRQ